MGFELTPLHTFNKLAH